MENVRVWINDDVRDQPGLAEWHVLFRPEDREDTFLAMS